MFGEKDLIFLGACILKIEGGLDVDEAIAESAEIYTKVFGQVSSDDIRKEYVEKYK